MDDSKESIRPIATNWLLTAASPKQQHVIRSTFMLLSSKTSQKGTAFSLTSGVLITNEHAHRICEDSTEG